MRQVTGDIGKRVDMRRRGQPGFTFRQIDHAGQRRAAKGAVDRHLGKVDLLQRVGHGQIGDSVFQHDGRIVGSRLQTAVGDVVTDPVRHPVDPRFQLCIGDCLAGRGHGDAGPVGKPRRAVVDQITESHSERHGLFPHKKRRSVLPRAGRHIRHFVDWSEREDSNLRPPAPEAAFLRI